jgi:PGF-pre-PGF domain-containing protein
VIFDAGADNTHSESYTGFAVVGSESTALSSTNYQTSIGVPGVDSPPVIALPNPTNGTDSGGGSGGGGGGGSGGGGSGGGGGGGSSSNTGTSSSGGSAGSSSRIINLQFRDAPLLLYVVNMTKYNELPQVTFRVNDAIREFEIQVKMLLENPTTVAPQGITLKYPLLSKKDISYVSNLKFAFAFSVPVWWIEQNNAKPENIVLKRYSDRTWKNIRTYIVKKDKETVDYYAAFESFEPFSITLDKQVVSLPIRSMPQQTPQEKPSPIPKTIQQITENVVFIQRLGWPLTIFLSVVVLGIIASVVLLTRRKPQDRTLHEQIHITLKEYVKEELDKGYSEEQILDRCVESGWPTQKVKLVIREVSTDLAEEKVQEYITKEEIAGIPDEKIEENLESAGWPKKTAEEEIKKTKEKTKR